MKIPFATALVGACALASLTSYAATPPVPPAAAFSPRVDNPWYPLRPGTTYLYRGVKDGEPARDVFTVTHRTTVVNGVRCVVVSDRLYLGGRLEERTTEWFSQDRQGNVWYFGEDTAELDEQGHVKNRSGSWRAGVKGARPGIFMFANPTVGRSAQQEFLEGEAEDHFRVVSLQAAADAPYVSSKRALLTREWTPLEPGTIDHKLFVHGIGMVREQTVEGPVERFVLVSVRKSP
jgi:hypothetical protein